MSVRLLWKNNPFKHFDPLVSSAFGSKSLNLGFVLSFDKEVAKTSRYYVQHWNVEKVETYFGLWSFNYIPH